MPLLQPPNSTTCLAVRSYASVAVRGDGLWAGNCWVQVLLFPSHCHVSFMWIKPGVTSYPPNMTTLPSCKSNTIPLVAFQPRGAGETGGNCRVQVTPSHVQV